MKVKAENGKLKGENLCKRVSENIFNRNERSQVSSTRSVVKAVSKRIFQLSERK